MNPVGVHAIAWETMAFVGPSENDQELDNPCDAHGNDADEMKLAMDFINLCGKIQNR